MTKISTYEELIKSLLYVNGKEICVGLVEDLDISDSMTPELREKVHQLLEGKRYCE